MQTLSRLPIRHIFAVPVTIMPLSVSIVSNAMHRARKVEHYLLTINLAAHFQAHQK